MTIARTEIDRASGAVLRRRLRVGGLAAAAVAMAAGGCQGSGGRQAGPPTTTPGAPAPNRPDNPTVQANERRPDRVSFLTRADTCERFAEAVRPVALAAVGPYGFTSRSYRDGGVSLDAAAEPLSGEAASTAGAPAPAAASPRAGVDFSGTNVQEAGVDEPDVVKTDGRLLVTTTGGRLRVLDVTGPPRQVGVLSLPPGQGNLLLTGNRALVLSNASSRGVGPDANRVQTRVTVVDLADPAQPQVVRTHTIDGSYVDARLIGGVVRLVTRSQPDISFPQPVPDDQRSAQMSQAANAEIVRKAAPAAFLPEGASCADAYVPAEASGVGTVAVQSIDPAADAPGPAVTVVANASTVYASANRLFVATNRETGGGGVRPAPGVAAGNPGPGRTAIHAFDITDPQKARYAGSGDVPGRLLNQFSLSEDAGVLRVATTLEATFRSDGLARAAEPRPGSSESRVTILRQAGEEWVETGAVDGLGKGERIYAVRFLGPTGYVVTFRQVDPLYVLDLRDMRAPKLTGELKITGYSSYLHPAGEGRLLGMGQEATERGRRVGTQLSLFDVADPAAPTKLAGAVLANSASSAESEHHAFLFWPATGLVVAPVRSSGEVGISPAGAHTEDEPFVGAVAFRVGQASVTEAARISHPGSTRIERSLVVGNRLLTLSQTGVAVNDLSSLADDGFVVFR